MGPVTPTNEPAPAGGVVFVHAHPDDEAIFTGGTIALLARAGVPVTVVFATAGELGGSPDHVVGPLEAERRSEVEWAAAMLGVHRVLWMGYRDSGSDPDQVAAGAFAAADVEDAAEVLAGLVRGLGAEAMVGYDRGGIYGHPDHVQLHLVVARAAELAGVVTRYDATVDREHLHFVETHLVEEAMASGDPDAPTLGLASSTLGTPTVLIDCAVDVTPVLAIKRGAMAAHASQIPAWSSALRLGRAEFADVYGWEWYLRAGPSGVLDVLARGGTSPGA